MAFTKRNEMLNIVPVIDAGGTVTDVQALMHVTLTENGVDTAISYAAGVSIWVGLTAAQQTQLAAIVTRIRTLALALDVPIPLKP